MYEGLPLNLKNWHTTKYACLRLPNSPCRCHRNFHFWIWPNTGAIMDRTGEVLSQFAHYEEWGIAVFGRMCEVRSTH